jgi:stearoyl-CoA desaturase (delta-9 desaturase)
MTLTDVSLCAGVFAASYSLSLCYITVFYHRGFAHGALRMPPAVRRFVAATGNWVTGIDVKAWTCMHRIHHAQSDKPGDPHSPVNVGVFGVAFTQLRSYERILVQLLRREPETAAVVADLEFDVHWVNRGKLGFLRIWWLPYLVHAAIGFALWRESGVPLLGLAFFVGIVSHPLQGWVVNALGHSVGSRNFALPDNSRNNHPAAWLIWGEGLQNNHHAFPASARFAYRRWELDFGYLVCLLLDTVGLVTIRREKLMPRPMPQAVRASDGKTQSR